MVLFNTVRVNEYVQRCICHVEVHVSTISLANLGILDEIIVVAGY